MIHDLYFLHVSGRATPRVSSGTQASVHIQDFGICLKVPLLRHPPLFKVILIRTSFICHGLFFSKVLVLFSLCYGRRFFVRYQTISIPSKLISQSSDATGTKMSTSVAHSTHCRSPKDIFIPLLPSGEPFTRKSTCLPLKQSLTKPCIVKRFSPAAHDHKDLCFAR